MKRPASSATFAPIRLPHRTSPGKTSSNWFVIIVGLQFIYLLLRQLAADTAHTTNTTTQKIYRNTKLKTRIKHTTIYENHKCNITNHTIDYCKSVTDKSFLAWYIIILFGPFTCLYCWFTVCLCECGYKCLNINNACKCGNGRPAWWALAFLAAHHLCNYVCYCTVPIVFLLWWK